LPVCVCVYRGCAHGGRQSHGEVGEVLYY